MNDAQLEMEMKCPLGRKFSIGGAIYRMVGNPEIIDGTFRDGILRKQRNERFADLETEGSYLLDRPAQERINRPRFPTT